MTLETTEETVVLCSTAGGEVEFIKIAAVTTVTEFQPPQPRVDKRISFAVEHLAEVRAGCGIERIDRAIAEVANQQIIAESAEIAGRKRHAPRRIERAAGNKSSDKIAIAYLLQLNLKYSSISACYRSHF